MKALLIATAGLVLSSSLPAADDAESLPFTIDPEFSSTWPLGELGISREDIEDQLVAGFSAYLSGSFLLSKERWPTCLDEMVATVPDQDRKQTLEWFIERVRMTFVVQGDDLIITFERKKEDHPSRFVASIHRAASAEEMIKKMDFKKTGEPGATDNPDGAQSLREDH